jgi:hypothetical protein
LYLLSPRHRPLRSRLSHPWASQTLRRKSLCRLF